jgi:Bacterial Ig-like domain (group 3)/FG-GAP-like repeat
MTRITTSIAALFCAVALMADPPACPSVQWALGKPSPSLAGYTYIRDVAVVDYDEDGELDVVGVVSDHFDKLVWWKGEGNSTFGAPNVLITNGWISNIAIADATGDGLDDVIAALYDHIRPDLYILPGTGSGRGPAIRMRMTVPTILIDAMNRDADPAVELVVPDISGNGFVVYDDIATTMTESARVSTAPFPRGVGSADFDADGRLDVAVGFPDGHTVAVYYGNADGTFDAPVDLGGVFPWNLVIGDLDGDGKQDIVAGNLNPDYVDGEGSVSIYMNRGGRAFTHTKFSVDKPGHASVTQPVLLADVSGDGVLDLVTGNVNGSWTTTAAGRGDGTFRTPTYQYTLVASGDSLAPYDLAAADFNGDGVLELLIGASSKGIYPATPSCTTQLDFYSVSPMVSIAQQATLHAHLSGFGPDTPMPHGTITLRDGATVVESRPVDPNGMVTFSLSGLTLGTHLLSAEFSGNTAVTAATSVVVTQKVTTATTKTTLTLPDFPAIYGQPFPIRIRVEGFRDESVTVELDGVRSRHYTSTPFAPPLEPGRHTIAAYYLGDPFRPPSDPLPVTFDVAQATPAMSKTGPLAVRTGTAHSFTFYVSGSGARGPAGSVQLTEGTTLLGSGELVNGSVTIEFTLTRGAHDVRAAYSGDARYAGVAQSFTLEVLPNQPFAIEARGLTTGVHIAWVLPPDVNLDSLQLYRRPAGGRLWQLLPGWNPATGMDSNLRTRGLVFEYLLHASLHNGTHISTLPDSALLFHDDPLPDGAVVKRVHFIELRSAVNLFRVQAGLSPFEFDGSYTKSSPASHLSGLRAALTQARQALGMSVPPFTGGELVQASHVQELRELAR